jgi:hypothetical protein
MYSSFSSYSSQGEGEKGGYSRDKPQMLRGRLGWEKIRKKKVNAIWYGSGSEERDKPQMLRGRQVGKDKKAE